MISKDNRTFDAVELRRQAEEIFQEKAPFSLENLKTLSPEEIQKVLHELQVHQIELEMQNEELRTAQVELEFVRTRYFDLYDLAPVGYCTLSEKGLILEANLTIATLLGLARSALVKQPLFRYIFPDDQDIYYLHRKQLLETGGHDASDLRMVKNDGTTFWAHLSCSTARDADSSPLFHIVISDITKRKFQEDERDLTARLIVLINTPGDFRKRMSELTVSLQGWSGCEAVGIRLQEGDDFPYFETRGFPPSFVEAEKHLCAYGPDGKILRDGKGSPILECMCGNILCGRFDAAKPFFTAHGSFWSNNTTALLASTTAADRQARTRNRCNGMGYESVALIPLRTGDQVYGLLQFNDHRPNRFSPVLIEHFERMADSLAVTLSRRQAEDALRASEERFRAVASSIPGAIYQFVKRPDGVYEIPFMSEGAVSLLERPISELQNALLLFEDVHPDDVEGMWPSIAESASSLTQWEREFRIVGKTGTIKWLRGVSSPSALPDGSICWNGVLLDITNLKRAEQDYKMLFREMLDGFALHEIICDEAENPVNYRFLAVNPAFERMTGLKADEITGKTALEILPGIERHWIETYGNVALSGNPIFFENYSVDLKKYFQVTAFKPAPKQFASIFIDITERKQAEEALITKTRVLENVFESSPYIMMLVTEEGRVTDINRKGVQFTGRSKGELLGLLGGEVFGCLNSFDGRGCGQNDVCEFCPVRSRVMQTFETGEPIYEGRGQLGILSDGVRVMLDILVSTTLVQSTEGRQVLVTIADITDRVQAEEQKTRLEVRLLQAQKMEAIGSLAGGIAHDLNNILFPISGLSEMLLDEIPPDNPAHESIEQIHKSAIRGSELVKQILAFSRQSKPQKLPIRIQSVLKEVLKLVRSTIPANIEIKSHINADCGLVSADPTQVHQIAMNLITNANHAVEAKGGAIDIELKERVFEKDDLHDILMKPGKYACITISDTGIGIDQTVIDKIFDPYFTTKEQGKGTGLGLSVVHGIVKEHDGDIRVYSEIGKGTAFHVYLPLLEDARNIKASAGSKKHPTGSESILLVDDEAPIAKMLQMMLERLGYQVTVRTSSPDALDTFRANPSKFDLVISDRGMPNMTGEQLARELISIRPGIPIILCTGFSDETDENHARTIGIKGFLKKPVATGDLATMVRKVLDDGSTSALTSSLMEQI